MSTEAGRMIFNNSELRQDVFKVFHPVMIVISGGKIIIVKKII
jgi:hypothetical protein